MSISTICFQVFTRSLDVVIRSPSHRIPSCDSSPLLIFSTIGEDNICGTADCVKVYIDNVRVSITRIGDAYGYDYYGADDLSGWVSELCECYGPYGYGPECYGYDHGYGLDDGYGMDGIPGTIDDTYGSERLPGTLHIFQLPDIADGRHTIRVVVTGTSGLDSESTETFIVDTQGPVITIISPVNDTINPISDIPVLEYEIEDFTGLLDVNVNIDGEDRGWLPSGTVLSDLKSGLHIITITAYDMATSECPLGNVGTATTRFNLLRPIIIDDVGRKMYVGTNVETQTQTVDAIVEELRVLNAKSTEADVLNEFKILRERIRFQLHEGAAVLTADEVLRLMEVDADSSRINLPNQTLMLCHYDNNPDSLDGVGTLAYRTNQVIEPLVAGRRIDVVVKYREGETIDRELIVELVNRVIPAFVEAYITFEAVE